MFRLCFGERLAVVAAIWLAIGLVGTGIHAAFGAIQDQSEQVIAEVSPPPARAVPGANSVRMTFEADGDFAAGHVRVVLRPDIRPLTLMQARAAAQEAFLETLNEPGFADVVNRITIVVELVPDASENDLSQVFFYESKDGKTWSVSAAQ